MITEQLDTGDITEEQAASLIYEKAETSKDSEVNDWENESSFEGFSDDEPMDEDETESGQVLDTTGSTPRVHNPRQKYDGIPH